LISIVVVYFSGEQTRQCGPGDVVTVCGIFQTVSWFVFVLHLMQDRSNLFCKLQVRIGGFRALISGLQADTYLEATHIEKQKLSYDAVQFADATDALVRTDGCIIYVSVYLCLSWYVCSCMNWVKSRTLTADWRRPSPLKYSATKMSRELYCYSSSAALQGIYSQCFFNSWIVYLIERLGW
jgi:hypothetical protein